MNTDWIEEVLEAWGQWRGTIGLAQGWGGAGNAVEHAGWAPPAAGVHSDPVLAEYMRSVRARNGDCALVDRLLTDFADRDRQVVFLRYVGEKRAKTTKRHISIGKVEIGARTAIGMRLEVDVPLHWEYSGKLPFAAVADHAGISEDAAARIVGRVKRQLRMQVMMMAKVRKGMAGEVQRAA